MRFLTPDQDFTYAAPEDAAWRRSLIHAVEQATGKPRLWRLYAEYCAGAASQDFFGEAVERLGLKVSLDRRELTRIPREGPLVVVANHPFGVVDGIVLGYLLSRVRADFRIVVHAALCRLPELQPYLLPIDFSETRAAQATNIATRRQALQDLKDGHAIGIFPSGGVATARSPLGRAEELEWKPFVGRMVQEGRAAVVPIFFEGQNSRLFQLASRVSMTLRLALLFHEVVNKMNRPVSLRVGAPLAPGQLAHFEDRRSLTEHLRALTYAPQPESETVFLPPFEPPLGPVFELR